jgi:hypothetical protein
MLIMELIHLLLPQIQLQVVLQLVQELGPQKLLELLELLRLTQQELAKDHFQQNYLMKMVSA